MTRDEEVLRRVLHTAADSIEPGADGLARIRSRVTSPRPASVAWLLTGPGAAGWLAGWTLNEGVGRGYSPALMVVCSCSDGIENEARV